MNVYLRQAYESLTAGKTGWWSSFSRFLNAGFPVRVAEDNVFPLLTARLRFTALGAPNAATRRCPAAAARRAESVPEKSSEPKQLR